MVFEIRSAEFAGSTAALSDCPEPGFPEYAFIGRSNVGKSSLINMITGRKGLAKTSSTPGKTQCINHFLMNREDEPWYLVDLPGYGYAKTSKDKRKQWQKFIRDYILRREGLLCLFVLIDARLAPQAIDLAFMEWLGETGIPFAILFTKTDKLSPAALGRNISAYKERMLQNWERLPDVFLTSAETGRGRDEILEFLGKTNQLF